MSVTPKRTLEFLKIVLKKVRHLVDENNLETSRLPPWLRSTTIRFGWINDTLVAVFEDSEKDELINRNKVHADTVLLLDFNDFNPSGASLPLNKNEGLVLMKGEYGDGKRVIFSLKGEWPALFLCGQSSYHGPLAFFDIFVQHTPGTVEGATPVITRFVPFALYVHENDVREVDGFWEKSKHNLLENLKYVSESEEGTFYEKLNTRYSTFAMTKKSGVIILGKDEGNALKELLKVKDYVSSKGYNADLIKKLPESPMMSNDEKVRLWTISSRFCIMIDTEASGHIKEYEILKQQKTVFALLRPKGKGSTHMIGDDEFDVNYIRTFEYDKCPSTVLDEVISWCEETISKRTDYYNEKYPWRN